MSPSAGIPSATAIDAMRPPIDLPPTNTCFFPARTAAKSCAARIVSTSSGARSGAFRPCSVYGKLNRSVPKPASFRHAVNPRSSGEFMPFPAPCATTTAARAPGGHPQAPVTACLAVSIAIRSSVTVTGTPRTLGTAPGWDNRAAVAGTLYLGTSGYAYAEWKGVFYPDELKSREMLSYFASRFRSVEINYTFRRHPSEKTLAQWREQTPEEFAFTLKAHQNITHRHRLADAAEPVAFFLERAALLGDRLGTILFQCPPSLRFDRDRLLAFLDVLPGGGRYAMEFRHPSWEEARPVLVERGVAWCMAETDEIP